MKRKLILILIGLIMTIFPYFINVYSIYRLLSVLIGLILIEIGLIMNKKDKAWRITFLPLIFLTIAFFIDYGAVHAFKNIPIFADKVISSKEVITYNSLFYREYSCDNKIIVDDLYKTSYPCDKKALETIDATSFLNNVIENYKTYQNKFVKIEGKVSKVNGTYNLEMQGYTLTEESINGYVLFSDSVTLEVDFNKIIDLTGYKVYDTIKVIGRIDELIKKGDNYTIRMYDSIILNSNLYESFELSVVPKNNCKSDKFEYAVTPDLTYYTSCLDKVFVKYDEENIYDLSYVLLDKKMTLEALTKLSEENQEENGNILYKYDQFNVLECANKKEVIIGNKALKVDSTYCKVEEPKLDKEL